MIFRKDNPAARYHFNIGLLAFFLLLLASYYAMIVERSFIHDGAEWFYLIIEKKTIRYHDTFWRQFNVLFQLPSVFLLKLFPAINIKYPIWLLHFFYNIHLFVSVLAVWIITAKREAYSLFYFTLLSCFIASISTYGFSVGIGGDTLSVFWPLFVLVFLRKEKSIFDFIGIFLLILSLAFTYETAILCFGVLILTGIIRWMAGSRDKFEFIILGLNAVGFFWCLWRLIGPDSNYGQAQSSLYLEIPFLIWSLFFILLFGTLVLCELFNFKLKHVLKLLLASLLVFSVTYFLTSENGPLGVFFHRSLFEMRLFSVPIGVSIAALFLLVWLLEKYKGFNKNFWYSRIGLFFLFCAIFVGVCFDLQVSKDWHLGLSNFRSYIERNVGCSQWSKSNLEGNNVGGLIADWTLPFLSLVVQKNLEPNAIVFSQLFGDTVEKKYCDEFITKGSVIDGYGILFPIDPSRFNFEKIRGAH